MPLHAKPPSARELEDILTARNTPRDEAPPPGREGKKVGVGYSGRRARGVQATTYKRT